MCKVGSWARVEGTFPSASQDGGPIMRNGVKLQDITVCASHVTIENEVRIQNCVVLPHKEIKKSVVGQVIM